MGSANDMAWHSWRESAIYWAPAAEFLVPNPQDAVREGYRVKGW